MRTGRLSGTLAFLVLSSVCTLADGVKLVHRPRQVSPDFNGHPRMIVEDADSHQGTAQAAVPGKSHPGGPICSFYSYARPAGIYRVTWRVKVDDNTIEDAVFKARTGKGKITLKGTDFKEPNVYQEFSYTAEKGEGGFFGVGASWPGKGRVLVDWITVISEKLYTERELLEKKGGIDLPDAWSFPPPSPARVHLAKGLWWDFFGLSEAIAEMGGAIVTSSYHGKGQGGTSLRHFPSSWRRLMDHHLVILTNVDAAALRARGRMLLEEFVNNGGSLLVLGGPFAFQRGGYQHTAMERLLPCRMGEKARLKAEGGLVLKPTKDAKELLPADLSWEMAPRLYYYHPLEPKDGTRVLVSADDKPVVMIGSIGKGRVAVVAATAEGDPPEGQLAFWEWGDMPRLVAGVCRWLLSVPREKAVHVVDDETRKQLEQLAVPTPGEKQEKRQNLLRKLLAKCKDKTFAGELLSSINNSDITPDRRFVEAVSQAVRPFIDESHGEEAEDLIDSQNAGKADLGLRILGLCRPEGAGERLSRFLEEGTGAFSEGEDVEDMLGAGGGLDVGSASDLGSGERLKLAAAMGLGDLGERGYVKALRKITVEFAKKRQTITQADDVADLKENIYQHSLAARCRLCDAQAVGPYLDAILKNTDEIEQFVNAFDNMLPNKDDKLFLSMLEIGRIRVPILHRRLALCMQILSNVPYVMSGEVAKELSRRNHPGLTPFAFVALTPGPGRKPTREGLVSMLPLIKECRIPELRYLVLRLALDLGDAEINSRLSSMLAELTADPDPVTARFALRRVGVLKQKDRLPIIAAGVAHPDAGLRRLAKRSLPLLSEEQRAKLTPATGP